MMSDESGWIEWFGDNIGVIWLGLMTLVFLGYAIFVIRSYRDSRYPDSSDMATMIVQHKANMDSCLDVGISFEACEVMSLIDIRRGE